MAFPLDKAELLALLLESIIFGIFLALFIILMAICFARDSIRLRNRKFILPVATAMMALAVAHIVIAFMRTIQGFATGDAKLLPKPIPYFANVANHLHVTKILIYGIQTLLGDAVLVWRCYIIYNKALYVIIPAGVVLLGNTALTFVIVWLFLDTDLGVDDYEKGSWRFVSSFFIITMGLNICCTIAIVSRVWIAHRHVTPNYGRSLFPVIAVIIESGAIYTAGVSSLVVTFVSKSNASYPALDLITPLVAVETVNHVYWWAFIGHQVEAGWGEDAFSTSTVAVHISEHAHADQDSNITANLKV